MQREATSFGLLDRLRVISDEKQQVYAYSDIDATCYAVRLTKQSLLVRDKVETVLQSPSSRSAIISAYSLVAIIISLQLRVQVSWLSDLVWQMVVDVRKSNTPKKLRKKRNPKRKIRLRQRLCVEPWPFLEYVTEIVSEPASSQWNRVFLHRDNRLFFGWFRLSSKHCGWCLLYWKI